MTPDAFPELAAALCEICREFGERQWCLATGGNFSVRVGSNHCLITQSGKDKSHLTPNDLMICDLDGHAERTELKPSAETPLHTTIYRSGGQSKHEIGAVFHTHSVAATMVSKSASGDLEVNGFEMQKALSGVTSHEQSVTIPVFDNDQDMRALAKQVHERFGGADPLAPAFLVRGHGLYAWGRDLAEAKRHTEGMEFLLTCLWQERLAGSR